jgi:hypothetical protein
MTKPSQNSADAADLPPPMPRWVKRSITFAAALILLIIAAMVLLGGEHGPGRHFPSADVSDQ